MYTRENDPATRRIWHSVGPRCVCVCVTHDIVISAVRDILRPTPDADAGHELFHNK